MDPLVIENLSRMPLWLRLNSGALVYLAPLSRTDPIDGHELSLNAELDRLTQQLRVRCNPAAAARAGPAEGERAAKKRAAKGAVVRRPKRARDPVAR